MAIISRTHDLLFIMTPRTASTALGQLLCRELNGKFLPNEDILNENGFFQVQKKHSTVDDLIGNQLLSNEEIKSLCIFTTVRNPFDNLVSLYQKRRSKYQPLVADPESWIYRVPNYLDDMEYCRTHSFNAWIFKHYSRSSIKRLLGGTPSMYRRFTERADVVLRFENIQADFRKFLQAVGIQRKLSIPHVNTTKERRANYRQYYNHSSRRIVEFALRDDLKRYGYEF